MEDVYKARKEGVAEFLLKFLMIEDVGLSVNIIDTIFSTVSEI